MSVETHSLNLNAAGRVGDQPSPGTDYHSREATTREPSSAAVPPTSPAQTRCNLEPRERPPKPEGGEASGLGRFFFALFTSLLGGAIGAWGYQRANLAPLPVSTAASNAARDVKPLSIGSTGLSDDADDEQNKALASLRADLDRIRSKLYAVQLRLNGADPVAKPEQTPELAELKRKVAELTIQTDRLAQLVPRMRTLDERIDQLAVSLKTMRDDLQTVQESAAKSGLIPPRVIQPGVR